MSLLMQWMVIGLVVVMFAGSGHAGNRKRRQNFFFPEDYNRFGFFDPVFSNRFDDLDQNRLFPPQGRVPFPTPIQPGPPAIIDPIERPAPTPSPSTMVTTPSPAFFACMQRCPTTSEYNPICGTNRQLYFNKQKFDCAIRCGARTEIWRRGSCEGLFPMSRG